MADNASIPFATLLLLLIGQSTLTAAQERRPEPAILFTGQYFGTAHLNTPTTHWFGLFAQNDSLYELRAATVRIDEVEPGICGPINTRVIAEGGAEPLFLVQGLRGLQEGPIHTVFVGQEFLYPGQSLALRWAHRDYYTLRALGTAWARPAEVLMSRYQLSLLHGRSQQVVVEREIVSLENPLTVRWVGDLDGDDRPDLWLDLPVGDFGERRVLYTSARAAPDSLVARTAEFLVPDC